MKFKMRWQRFYLNFWVGTSLLRTFVHRFRKVDFKKLMQEHKNEL